MNILLTGATGLVGRKLGIRLVEQGHQLTVLTRNRDRAAELLPFPATLIEADLVKEASRDEALRQVDAVIHLAGENIASARWSPERRQKIYDSRVKILQNLLISVQDNPKIQAIVSTSAVGIYGDRGNEELVEDSGRGEGFLSQVCQDWEQPLLVLQRQQQRQQDTTPRTTWRTVPRVVIFRLGVILDETEGALAQMRWAFQQRFAGPLGSGQQWLSWIHIDDVISLYSQALINSDWQGVYNATAPQPVTNRDFSLKLLQQFHPRAKRMAPAVPNWALQIALGDRAEILLQSQKVLPKRLSEAGYEFQYPTFEKALSHLCRDFAEGQNLFVGHQYLPCSLNQVFEFFGEAQNLEKITPPFLHFHVAEMSTPRIQKGSQIKYNLRIRGVPLSWTTDILEWQPPSRFVDSQKKGPYASWVHEHRFQALGPGTLMSDRVVYQLPLGKLGALFGGAYVAHDVAQIFAFRRMAVMDFLPKLRSLE